MEDNLDDEALTKRGLARCSVRIDTVVVRDGAEALRLLHSRPSEGPQALRPRLVLLDLRLPGLGGLEVLQAIRDNPSTSTVPVVCLTSTVELASMKKAYQLRVNSYVCKPVAYEEYLATISKTVEYWLSINCYPD